MPELVAERAESGKPAATAGLRQVLSGGSPLNSAMGRRRLGRRRR